MCGRAYPFPRPALGPSGVVCEACAREDTGAVPASPAALGWFERLRSARWEEALVARIGGGGSGMGALLENQVSRPIGPPARTAQFLRGRPRLRPAPAGHPPWGGSEGGRAGRGRR